MTKLWRAVAWCATAVILNSTWASAATYYLSTTGNNNNSCSAATSSSAPKATFASAWGCASAGDTLMVADGSYQDASPPSGKAGTAGALITVRATNDGAAKVTQQLNIVNNSYLAFIGLKITGSSTAINVVSGGSGKASHHLTFQRLGFTCTSTSQNDSACFSLSDGTHDVLVEDFWGWGGGRYTVMCYGGPGGGPPNTTCDNNTFRRGVLRMGPSSSSSGNPQAGLALYYASSNVVENVIVLDGQAASDTSNSAFYLTSHAAPPTVSNNKFYGVIALNNYGVGWYLDHDGTGSNNELRNSVIWDSQGQGIVAYGASSGVCSGTLIDHVTSGANGGAGVENYCHSTNVKSSIMVNNGDYGIRNGSAGTMTENWNDLFGNSSGARTGVSAGGNDKTTNPALAYVARIEAASTCVGGGEAGTSCGADVRLRYQDGVLTTASLWPWPYEARIRKEMCTDAGVSRGFCSAPSLTDYVWGYLGNTSPYSGGTSGSAPVAPVNVRVIQVN